MTTQAEVRDRLRAFLTDELGVPGDLLDDDMPLLEAGLIDSLGVVEVVAFCEDELQCVVPPEDIAPDAFQTFDALVSAAVDRWNAGG